MVISQSYFAIQTYTHTGKDGGTTDRLTIDNRYFKMEYLCRKYDHIDQGFKNTERQTDGR